MDPATLIAYGPSAGRIEDGSRNVLDATCTPYVAIRLSNDGSTSFSTGPAALFPFYVWHDMDGATRFSWLLEDAALEGELDTDVAASFLEFRQTYTSRTLLKNVHQLTERARIVADGSGIRLCPPEDHRALESREITSEEAAVDALVDVLSFAVGDSIPDISKAVVELSGGRDSSLLALLPVLSGARSYGIIFPGEAGRRQGRRRDRIAETNRLRDVAVSGSHVLRGSTRLATGVIDPRADLYGPLTVAGLQAAGISPGHFIVTGIGGDEAFAASVEADPISGRSPAGSGDYPLPKAWLPETGLMAACSRFAFFQSLDCWPVYPYLHPEVVDFGYQLPERMLCERRLQMLALNRLGMTTDAMLRPTPENYLDLLTFEYETVHQRRPRRLDERRIAFAMRRHALGLYIERWRLRLPEPVSGDLVRLLQS